MIFVDSSFWIAVTIAQDHHHTVAVSLFSGMGNEPVFSTNHVRGETWTYLTRKAGHRAAVGFLDLLERSSRLEIVHVPVDLERRALTWLRQHDEREYSFVDATSFAVMRSLKIRKALAFDGDFAAAGFIELRA